MSASTVEVLRPVEVSGRISVKDKLLEGGIKAISTVKVLGPIVKGEGELLEGGIKAISTIEVLGPIVKGEGELPEGDVTPGIFLNGNNEEISTVEVLEPIVKVEGELPEGDATPGIFLNGNNEEIPTVEVLEPIVNDESLESGATLGMFLNADDEVISKEVKEIVGVFKEKFKDATTTQKNAFLNKLGIEVINDKNPEPEISDEKISDSALHSLTQELLVRQASEQTGQNTFLRTDYGYLSISKKLLAEEGKRHPLEEGGKVPDVIVDHLKAILKAAPKVLNSENGISIEDIARVVSFNIYNTYTGELAVIDKEDLAMKLAPSYTPDLSGLRKDSLPDDVALKSIKGLAETFEPEVIAAPVVVAPVASTPSLRASFSEKISEGFSGLKKMSEGFFGFKSFVNKFVGTVESFIYDSINLINEGIKAVTMDVDHQDLAIEVEGEGAYHNESI